MKPITNVSSPDIACNGAVNTWLHQPDGVAERVITVPAGAKVITEWYTGIPSLEINKLLIYYRHHTLQGLDPSDSADPIDPSHLVR